MNILPKKSWHVLSHANIERVRKDEEKAANEEKDRQRRIALAEQEARTELLRAKAKNRSLLEHGEVSIQGHEEGPADKCEVTIQSDPGSSTEVAEYKAGGHINFFQENEASGGVSKTGTNKEYEDEKKEEKEKQEKAIGLLTYLGQSAIEAQTSQPWYYKPPEKIQKKNDDDETTKDRRLESDLKKKNFLDPMMKMKEYVDQKKLKHKDKHHKKSKHRNKDKTPSGKKTMDQLRTERLDRETAERQKTDRLLAKLRGEKLPGEAVIEVDDRKRGYNSQYNPDIAKSSHLQHNPDIGRSRTSHSQFDPNIARSSHSQYDPDIARSRTSREERYRQHHIRY